MSDCVVVNDSLAGVWYVPESIAPIVISPAIKSRIDPTQKREDARMTGLGKKRKLGSGDPHFSQCQLVGQLRTAIPSRHIGLSKSNISVKLL